MECPKCHTKTESNYCGNCGTALDQTNSSDDQHGAIFKATGSNGEIELYDDRLIIAVRGKKQIPFTEIHKINYEPKLKFIMFTIINDRGRKEKLKINFAKGQIDSFDKLTDLCEKKGIEIAKDKICNRISVVFFIVLVFMVILAGTSSDDNQKPRNTPSTSDIQAENSVSGQTSTEDEKVKLENTKIACLKFEKDILDIDKKATSIRDNFFKKSETGNNVEIYSLAKIAKELTDELEFQIANYSIEKNITEDIENKLESIKESFASAYYCQSKAFEYGMEYCENQKPSAMSSMKEELQKAQNYTIKASALLVDVKWKIGI